MLPKAAKTATEAEEAAVAVVEEDIVIIIVEDTTTIGEVIVDMATTAEVDTRMEEVKPTLKWLLQFPQYFNFRIPPRRRT